MVTGLMQQIAIHTCHGGFCLSHKAFLRLRELGQRKPLEERDLAALKIVEIPPDVRWQIVNAHGVERVSEVHREWS